MQTVSSVHRFLAIAFLLAVLTSLFVWAETLTPDPAMNYYPGNGDVGPAPYTLMQRY